MKNQNILFASTITLFVMSSACKKDNPTEPVLPETRTAVQFSSSINGQIKTKALNDTWETNDAIGVFMKTGTGLANVIAANKSYNTTGNGEFKASTTDQTLYYPENGSSVDFLAYYPFKQSLSNNIYPVDISNQNTQSTIDLLYANNATGLSKTSTAANLVFTHQLSKIEFTVKTGAGVNDLNGLTTSIAGLNTKADFDLASGVLSNQTQLSDITAKTGIRNTAVVSEMIILPVADASGKQVTFSLPAGKFKLTLPANTKFEQGKKYTYEIELKNDGTVVPVAVALSATITNWTNVPSGSYTVDQDVVIPPVAVETVVYTETFGTGTIPSTKPKIGTYTNYDNKGLTFSDTYGNADLRTISSYGDGTNAHVWFPATKDASVSISGINLSGYTKLKIKYDLAANITGSTATGNLNVIKVKINGVDVPVSSQPIAGTPDQNKFYTLEIADIAALANNTIEFSGAAATNTYGIRLDNIVIIGVK